MQISRALRQVGRYSLYLNLPVDEVIRAWGLRKGDSVDMEITEEAVILKFPRPRLDKIPTYVEADVMALKAKVEALEAAMSSK